ncbi:MAG: FtsX-like permease family protein, partial [Candidatus Latescibacteria bacterium]|nr:FtsX-like permease family protein [Candidatus Latescibacterota bacterium]
MIRIREGSAEAFGAYLKSLWKDLKTEQHLTFSYVEDERQHFYAKEISWSKIVSGAALCAVLIASMGALGMISLSVARRRKEIAIRRVMGAVPSKIASGIVLNYALPGFVAAVIALPLSYFFMDEWLSIFAYRFQ